MADRNEHLQGIATLIADYRSGEIAPIDAVRVDKWIRQFPEAVQLPLLAELAHVLGKTYLSKATFQNFLEMVASSEKFVGTDAKSFWQGVRFLDLQTVGNSQRDMLALFDAVLQAKFGLSIADCGANPHTYVYLDDALYSGGRIKSDLIKWIDFAAPPRAKVAIITIALHQLGEYFANGDITKAIKASGKNIEVSFWRAIGVEDRKAYMGVSDVLRPTLIPNDPAIQAYVEGLGAAPILRTAGNIGGNGFFSSDAARILIEQEFLKAGVRVRGMCPHLNAYMRPLGCSLMKTTGFGSMVVTYRNCANNTPLVFWAGDPWYPLFPRKTN